MWVGVLGPLQVLDGQGQAVEVAGGRLRALLARLAVAPGQLVTNEALVDAVWAEQPPTGAANALQSLVSRLRRAFGPQARIEALPAGYRLSDVDVDLGQFERLVALGAAARARDDLIVD